MSIQEQKIDEGGKTVRRDKTTSATSHNRWRPNPYKTQMSYGSLILKTFKVWDMEIISALWMGRKSNSERGGYTWMWYQSCRLAVEWTAESLMQASSWDLWRKGAVRWLGIRVFVITSNKSNAQGEDVFRPRGAKFLTLGLFCLFKSINSRIILELY